MIYSASRRTDMPAFHPEEIELRVKRSRRLDGIVLWTKDIRNCVGHAGLAGVMATVPCLVNFTATGLAGTRWEPGVPPLAEQTEALAEVARRLPAGAVRWRFDPIIITDGEDWRERFVRVRAGLETALGALDHVTVSFPDPYRDAVARVKKAGRAWPAVAPEAAREAINWIAAQFPASANVRPAGAEAKAAGTNESANAAVRLCCEAGFLDVPGVSGARCIDGRDFDRLYGTSLGGLGPDAGQRSACGCTKSTDIGGYGMVCGHGCLYCYAARGAGIARGAGGG